VRERVERVGNRMTGVDLLNPSEAALQRQLPLFTFIPDKASDIDTSVNRNKNFVEQKSSE